ncbi:hypothetical protein QP162_04790 [Sphingomonas aurantiaca]|uniref:hypothetical protein n=1 Tax=Sphingomonas aurantiaca TaxID=185949 RepID=UPI002FE096B1
MSQAGLKLFPATSIVGARIRFSSDGRQPQISLGQHDAGRDRRLGVLLRHQQHALADHLLARFRVVRTEDRGCEIEQPFVRALADRPGLVGRRVDAKIRNTQRANTAIFASAEAGNSGVNGISVRRSRIRRFQSRQAVDQIGTVN